MIKKQSQSKPIQNVVIMGGGNGGSISIRAMKTYIDYYNISAIIAMSDSGGSSGRLRQEFGVLPPGDILRAVIAMSKYDYDLMKRIFYTTRFSEFGKLHGHGLGHLFIALCEKYNGGIVDAIRALAQALDVVGPVFPVTIQESNLYAELDDGTILKSEHEIDRPESCTSHIKKVWLHPSPMIYERTLLEYKNADVIIIGPGSFYCSILATLLPDGVFSAINESHAKLIYVTGNAIEKYGERGPVHLSEFVRIIQTYLPRKIDAIIYNGGTLTQKQIMYYEKKDWAEIIDDTEKIEKQYLVIKKEYEKDSGGFDIVKLGTILHECIQSF